jgi:hypothetical protein
MTSKDPDIIASERALRRALGIGIQNGTQTVASIISSSSPKLYVGQEPYPFRLNN